MVLVRNIDFYSLCEHHLLPFFGRCHVAYVPRDKVVGLSKIPRIVDVFSRRLQVQERLTNQIADGHSREARPAGRRRGGGGDPPLHGDAGGREAELVQATTSAMLGSFREDARTRMEFLNLLNGRGESDGFGGAPGRAGGGTSDRRRGLMMRVALRIAVAVLVSAAFEAEAQETRVEAAEVQLPGGAGRRRHDGRRLLRRADPERGRAGHPGRRPAAPRGGDGLVHAAQPPHLLGERDARRPRLRGVHGRGRSGDARRTRARAALHPERVPGGRRSGRPRDGRRRPRGREGGSRRPAASASS